MERDLSPWAQDQRRIRRLRAKVRAERERADINYRSSEMGWQTARKLFEKFQRGEGMTAEDLARWEKHFEENEPF